MHNPLFILENIKYSYGPDQVVFTDLNLQINYGESICILGTNGAGKSSILKIMAGLIFPNQGVFQAFGQKITEELMDNDQFSREFHCRVGFIFQNPDIQLFNTRVWDEIAFGLLQLGLNKKQVTQRVTDVMELLDITHLQDRSPYHLSGGEKKKIAIASVLALNPQVLILDEPTNGLDPRTQRYLINLLLELHKRGRTIVIATHNLDLAHILTERVLLLAPDHKVAYNGATDDILKDKNLLMKVNLIDEYYHVHGAGEHAHLYRHG